MSVNVIAMRPTERNSCDLYLGTAYGANMGSPTQGGCIAGWIKLSNWCYYVNNQINVTWHQAQTECSKRGSELLTIASAKNLVKSDVIIIWGLHHII